MQGAEIEEVRFRCGEVFVRGQWDLPREVPPLALVFIPPSCLGRDRFGTSPGHPAHHLHLSSARSLVEAGMGVFSCDAPPRFQSSAALCEKAWAVALDHHLISRSRVGILGLGPESGHLLKHLRLYKKLRSPMALVLAAPPLEGVLPGDPHVRLHVLFGAEAGSTRAEFMRHAASAFQSADEATLLDLTPDLRRESDRAAGRWLVHPLLGPRIAAAFSRLLRPTWERTVRPPGTAIG